MGDHDRRRGRFAAQLTLGELKDRFENVTHQLVLECGGNGRSQFVPAARGNPWTTGGVGCARWTGVRLKDVLEAAGPFIDASALESLEAIVLRLQASGVTFHLSEVKGPVMDRLQRSCFLEHLTGEVFLSQYHAMARLDPTTTCRAAQAALQAPPDGIKVA